MKKKVPSKGNNKALYKAVSLLPTTIKSNVPAIYIKSLPMVIGAIVIVVILFQLPENIFEKFSNKNEELKSHLIFSLRAGMTSYSNQIKNNINILPIDTKIEPQLYGGRVEPSVDRAVFAESMHAMTASVSEGFSKIKPESF